MLSLDNRVADKERGNKLTGPLQGIKVLDLTRVLAGPWASQLCADYGADVIKVERPTAGDDTRHWGPPFLQDQDGADTRESAYFCSANRNKRSITVNLANSEGQQIIRDLVANCDVLLENFKVGDLKRHGLDYQSLRNVNPGLIYCSISAYGQTGSRASEPGYDAMIQGAAGLMSITGEPEVAGGRPQKVGVAIADIMAGMYAATAVLAALFAREKNGQGQFIDIALYDSQVAWLANQNMNYLIGGESPGRYGSGHPNLVPYQSFATADGDLMLAVGNERQFAACAECLGHAEWAADEKFSTNAARLANRSVLVDMMIRIFKSRSTGEWLRLFQEQKVPAGPINTIGAVFQSDYAQEKGFVQHLPHAVAGTVPSVANPVQFSETPVSYRLAPPMLGEHTVELLTSELGYSTARIQELRKLGAI